MSPALFGFGGAARDGDRPAAQDDHTFLVVDCAWYKVTDEVTAEVASRAAAALGRRAGLGDPRAEEITRGVDALGGMLHRHGTGGRIALRRLWHSGVPGLEVVAINHGPGISDLTGMAATGDGGAVVSRSLGAVVQLATWYDGYSLPGRGATVVAQFWPRGVYPGAVPANGICRAIQGERASGDQFSVALRADGPLMLVADGLGHGPLAEAAALAAVDAFHGAIADLDTAAAAAGGDMATPATPATVDDPVEIVEYIHQAIAHTRGAAVAVAKVVSSVGLVRFAGLGNIAAAVVGAPGTAAAGRTGMISQPGIAGHQRRTVCEFTYPIAAGGIVVIHTDGVTDRWDLAAYPGLAEHEPLVVAATLLRDAGVRRDDACVLVARLQA